MIPLVMLGVGLLLGGGAMYVYEEHDKQTLREVVRNLETSHQDLERRVQRARDTEVQHRVERLQLILRWSQARLNELLARNEVSLRQLQRVWTIGKAIEEIVRELPANGNLDRENQRFVDLVIKAQERKELTPVERHGIDKYLANHFPEAMREFLEDRLSEMFRRRQRDLLRLRDERVSCDRERRALELRAEVEGLRDAGMTQKRARLQEIEAEVAKVERALDDIKRNLVIVARLGREEMAQDEFDGIAREILERIVHGKDLSDADRNFLSVYRDTYFLRVRELLKTKRGIDLAELGPSP